MSLKKLYTLLLLFGVFTLSAQEDCECADPDPETEGICIEVTDDGIDFILWVPDECTANCYFGTDYTIVEDCENDWEWEDECECDEDDWSTEGICFALLTSNQDTIVEWAPSECYATCWFGDEYSIVDCDNGWGWEDDCECPEEDWSTDGICYAYITTSQDTIVDWAPSECYASCWSDEEYFLVDCDNGWGSEGDCECPEEDWDSEGICIEIFDIEFDSTGFVTWVPSACFADCWYVDYLIVEDCDNGWGWEDDCECPEEDWESEGICIEIFEIEFDTIGFVTWVPSVCFADCWYDDYTLVDCPEGGIDGGACDWDLDCECEIDSEEGICIAYIYADSIFGVMDTLIEWVPNECYADCWGFVDYAIIDCEDAWDWNDEEGGETTGIEFEGDAECVLDLLETEELTFQSFLIGLHECGALVLDDCVLTAPVFETDEEFIDYLLDSCPEWFGIVMDESEGPSLFRSFEESQEQGTTSVNDIEGLDIDVLGNPVADQLNVAIATATAVDLQITVSSTTGIVLYSDQLNFGKGEQVFELNTSAFSAGIYHMILSNSEGSEAIKFVVMK